MFLYALLFTAVSPRSVVFLCDSLATAVSGGSECDGERGGAVLFTTLISLPLTSHAVSAQITIIVDSPLKTD